MGYLMRRVLGGSSVFRVGGRQLAGMLDRSQLSADPTGRILREAFVVRARTIGQNLVKLPGRLVARMEEIEPFNLQWFRDRVGTHLRPILQIPPRPGQFLLAALSRANERVPLSDYRGGINAIVRASRGKLSNFYACNIRDLLRAKIAEGERTRRLVRMLSERAQAAQLTFDHEAAKSAFAEIARLAPDDVWAWINLGELVENHGIAWPRCSRIP